MKRYFLFLLLLISCDFNKKSEDNYVARVGEEFLSYSYLNDLIPKNISVEDSVELANKIIEIMENAVKLEVPNKVDYEHGPNWGKIK